ncbi:MAG TPA: GvpL/GvpF family gas vesicle protein [Thermoleophilaceae bacterium]|nr:GvpL/GvpF family gas vesicle protein [Thermoleophilaceae bacterium]
MASNVYVYGVTSASRGQSLEATGIEDSEVGVVEEGPLAALVSPMKGDALSAAREVRAHWRVLEDASRQATVLPVRFGTVMESGEAVRERLLAPNAERLATLLEELEGRVQLTVKGEYREEVLMREVVETSPSIAQLRERLRGLPEAAGYYDRIRLGEMVASEITQRSAEDSALARSRLDPVAIDTREGAQSSTETAFNLAFLVDRDRVDEFGRAVAALGSDLGERVALRFVGPQPPYSFADADLSAESASWA